MTAAMTPLPVLGVPVESKALSGVDSLYSIVQMPAGVPVGTLAIGKAGAINAALLAAAILALNDDKLAARLDAWRAKQTAAVAERPERRWLRRTISARARGSALSAAASSAACWRWPQPRLGLSCHIYTRPPGRARPSKSPRAGTVAAYDDDERAGAFRRLGRCRHL